MMFTMTSPSLTDALLAQLQSELDSRVHPYLSVVPGAAGTDAYEVQWTGTPSEDEMRSAVTDTLSELRSPLDPAQASYKRSELNLDAFANEAMRLNEWQFRNMTKRDVAELRADLERRLRTLSASGGTRAVMGFMRTVREQASRH